ncbi:MAG: hypothetical protein RJA63_2495 [Pseudomonadota bacterium]|jgi:hypothetical protein
MFSNSETRRSPYAIARAAENIGAPGRILDPATVEFQLADRTAIGRWEALSTLTRRGR